MGNFTWLDNTILGVFIVSVLAGLMRGFVKEVISVLTWLAGFVVAAMFSSDVAASFTSSGQVQSVIANATSKMGMSTEQPVSMLALGISFIGLFVATVLIGTMINYFISSMVESRGISFGNRLLGAVFGLGRGLLLVVLMMFLVELTPLQQQPYWQQSQFVKSFQPAVKWLSEFVQPGLDSLKSKMGGALKGVDTQYFHGTGTNMLQNVTTPPPQPQVPQQQ